MTSAISTPRLTLARPAAGDIDALHSICADPRVWTHYPSLRHYNRTQTEKMVVGWQDSWDKAELGTWTVRLRSTGEIIGYGGCSLLHDRLWNLGYRIDADHHGHGYATELAREARAAAEGTAPELTVIAYLVEHNHASAGVAKKVGLTLVDRGPDTGNPDPNAIRVVYSSRNLTTKELDIVRK
ncbi:MAG: GNAT family N-acetyltransferase [Leucobacter sp.]